MQTETTDGTLLALLKEAGSPYTKGQLHRLVRAVAGAPAAFDDQAWMTLVGPNVSDALREQLAQIIGDVRAGSDYGLECKKPPVSRLNALRAEMRRMGLDGFLIPRVDAHQGEYVPPHSQRLTWVSGFSGSAGMAIVLQDKAAIFIDGRYTLQVEDEVDTGIFEAQHLTEQPPSQWLKQHLNEGDVLGFDPWLHTPRQLKVIRKTCDKLRATLKPTRINPVDEVWGDQPPPPVSPVTVQAHAFAGKTSEDKRRQLGDELGNESIHAAVLTQPDSIAWLLNIRGADIPRTPFPLSFAVLYATGKVSLYIDTRKLTADVRAHLGDEVTCEEVEDLGPCLEALGRAAERIQVDASTVPQWVIDRLDGARIVETTDPCALPKACKNAAELEGARESHRRDGASLTRFLAWLDKRVTTHTVTEMDAADALEGFRRENEQLRNLSFDTISGAAGNGAIVHYRVDSDSDRPLEHGSLYLVDSGGQYVDGTTDVTRTVAIGEPTDEMKDRFTRVLKGHIALGSARFPTGTSGSQLDALARLPLWQVGLDYDHGTGHGVGSFLSVHEGPHRIAKRNNGVALKPGMIISNEPGYYKTGEYGIRIENLVIVIEAEVDGAERSMLAFETITLAPIDRRLIVPELLTQTERDWLNQYHARVREELTPRLDEATVAFLETATAPI